jgi:hypothetical protein
MVDAHNKSIDSTPEKDRLFYWYFVKYEYGQYPNVIQVNV